MEFVLGTRFMKPVLFDLNENEPTREIPNKKRAAMFACCAAHTDVRDGTGSKGHDTASHTRWFRIKRSTVPHTDFRKTQRHIFATPLSCLTFYLKLYRKILQMDANSITKYRGFSFHLPTLP